MLTSKLEAIWTKLIGTAQRAKKLRQLLPKLGQATIEINLLTYADGMPAAYLSQRKPAMCPTKLLYGDKESQKFYLNAEFRPALDAWDNGEVTVADIRKICRQIEASNGK